MRPFKGLSPFCEQDAELFFGREEEIGRILGSLKARRLTILHGESGVGKTSILRAGVASRIRSESTKNMEECGYPRLAAVVFPGVDEAESWLNDPLPSLKLQIERDIERIDPTIPPVKDLPFVETLAEWTDWLGGRGKRGSCYLFWITLKNF